MLVIIHDDTLIDQWLEHHARSVRLCRAITAGEICMSDVYLAVDLGGTRIRAASGHDFSKINVELIAQAAANGDAIANTVLDRASKALGLNIVSLLHIFNPSIVIIGGSVSNLGDRMFQPLRSIVAQHVMNPRYLCPIVPAGLSHDVGLSGALALALDPPQQHC